MAHLIITKPNGKLALWSSIAGAFVFEEIERDALIEYWVSKYRSEVEKRISDAEIAGGESMTWGQCQDCLSGD